MIKALSRLPDGTINLMILGLSRENCTSLLDGKPIAVKMRELSTDLPDISILIVGGETEDAIAAELQGAFDHRGDDDGGEGD